MTEQSEPERYKRFVLDRGGDVWQTFDGTHFNMLTTPRDSMSRSFDSLQTNYGPISELTESSEVMLPTLPGLYLGAKEHAGNVPAVFRLDEQGRWWLLNTGSLFPPEDERLQFYAPLQRLVST